MDELTDAAALLADELLITVRLDSFAFEAGLRRSIALDIVSAIDEVLDQEGVPADAETRIAMMLAEAMAVEDSLQQQQTDYASGVAELTDLFCYAFAKRRTPAGLATAAGLVVTIDGDDGLLIDGYDGAAEYEAASQTLRAEIQRDGTMCDVLAGDYGTASQPTLH